MSEAVSPLLVLVLLLNFAMLGTSRLRAVINASAAQGVILGILVLAVHGHLGVREVLLAGGAVVLKGVVIPGMLVKAMRDVVKRRDIEPLIGYIP